MLLELEADPSVLGPHSKAVFLFVQRGSPGPVDNIRSVLDSVLEGNDMGIVHCQARSLHARLEFMDRAGTGLAIVEAPGQGAQP